MIDELSKKGSLVIDKYPNGEFSATLIGPRIGKVIEHEIIDASYGVDSDEAISLLYAVDQRVKKDSL